MIHTGRHFLQIPGPTNVPDRVLRAMDRPICLTPGGRIRDPENQQLGLAFPGQHWPAAVRRNCSLLDEAQ